MFDWIIAALIVLSGIGIGLIGWKKNDEYHLSETELGHKRPISTQRTTPRTGNPQNKA